jgi:putative tryptophan/tyrosine transport system substrate-binding protein
MRRREFITLVSGAVASPLVARAQQSAKMKRIVIVNPSEPPEHMLASYHPFYRAFFDELSRQGFVEGKNLVVERLCGDGQTDRIFQMLRHAVDTRPDAIFSLSGIFAGIFKNLIKTTIPIVSSLGDPVVDASVASLAHPGGNITGVSVNPGPEVWGKRIGLLQEALPKLSNISIVAVESQQGWDERPFIARQAAKAAGVTLMLAPLVDANRKLYEPLYTHAFATIEQDRPDALIVNESIIHYTNRRLIIEFAAKHRLPALYTWKDFVEVGGLMSYAFDMEEFGRYQGYQMGQVLSGINPGDLPIIQINRLQLTLNLKTAKSLGIEFPATLLGSADFIIE